MSLPLQNEVCMQDQARQLYEYGVKQQSQFYWRKMLNWDIVAASEVGDPALAPVGALYSAFTIQEIFELLPVSINGYTLQITKTDKDWVIQYVKARFFIFTKNLLIGTDLVGTLIYLLHNKLVDPKSL